MMAKNRVLALLGATLVVGIVATAFISGDGTVSRAGSNSSAQLRSDSLCPIGGCGGTDPGPDPDPFPDVNSAHFTWALEQLRENKERESLIMPPTEFYHETPKSLVTLRACDSTGVGGISEYRWTFSNGDAPITKNTCGAEWHRDVSRQAKAVDVTLTIVAKDGSTDSVTQTIHYRDIVIASLGDSAASGQGAPDSLGSFSIYDNCYRSGYAASAQAALRLQKALAADTTVHFWFLACSGASITAAGFDPYWGDKPERLGGMLDPYDGAKHQETLPPQVDRLGELIQELGLGVDRLFLSIGANETHWADVVQRCLPMAVVVLPFPIPDFAQQQCLRDAQGHLTEAVSALPAHFTALGDALNRLVPPNRIYLTEYFDPLDSLVDPGAFSVCPGEVLAGRFLRQWGIAHVENPLQDAVQNAAQQLGWNYVDGIREAFQGHGVCQLSTDARWTNSWSDSLGHQNDTNGSWHADFKGHTEIANLLYPIVLVAVTDNPPPTTLPPATLPPVDNPPPATLPPQPHTPQPPTEPPVCKKKPYLPQC